MPQKQPTISANNLPGLLSAVLAHPDLPERIFTGIADNLLDMNLSAQVNFFTPDMIERTLVAYTTHETKQPRGRQNND